jgi:hypothetical protein
MSTNATWFASVEQARLAVLDLLTSGVPRQDISVVIGASNGEQAQTGGDSDARHFVAALMSPGALTLPKLGSVVVGGPLADALAPANAGTAEGDLHGALVRIGIPADQAGTYAEELRHDGALIAVRSDDSFDTIVLGVFRHNADPSLREQEELVGPTSDGELLADEPPSTSIGALTEGMVPGGWGAAGDIFEDQAEDAPGDEKR